MNTLQLLSFGGALPQNKVTNNDLAKIVETSDEWIKSRTGIAERRFCAEGETASGLAIRAAAQAPRTPSHEALERDQAGARVRKHAPRHTHRSAKAR